MTNEFRHGSLQKINLRKIKLYYYKVLWKEVAWTEIVTKYIRKVDSNEVYLSINYVSNK